MKRIVFGLSMGALLLHASCKKDLGGLTENSWSVSGKTYTASTVDVSSSSNFISASNGTGSSIDFSFKTLPSSNTDLDINDVAYTNSEVAIRTILSGSIIYNSVPSKGTFLSLRVNNGKYTLIGNNIKMVNAKSPKDTVIVSTNIVQP
ncbi:MAG: hypothetical protein V4561_11050 [Bacteroidota bacterium]